MITTRIASLTDLNHLSVLFDAYRVFYKQESSIQSAKKFLEDRMQKKQSVIFIAYTGQDIIGFTQLYPTFSSVTLKESYILNDLFVSSAHRKKGVATSLLNTAKKYCIKNNAKGLALETAVDNPAQHLYEKLDWQKDTNCYHYFWSNPNQS